MTTESARAVPSFSTSAAEVTAYMKILKAIAAGDGTLAPAELVALRAGMARVALPREIAEEVERFDPKNADLGPLIAPIAKGGIRARMLLRDAIEIARADGAYGDGERAKAARAAALLGIDAQLLSQIEALVELEHAVATLRDAVFLGEAYYSGR